MNREEIAKLYKKYDLTESDVFKHQHYLIITRAGIDKIQAKADINISYELIHNSNDNKCVIIKATAEMDGDIIETFGESSPENTVNKYPVAMAEKRAMSRAVLKLTGFYAVGAMGQDESDEFKQQ
jgi:hypothetical protein